MDNVRFIKLNSFSAIGEHATPKYFVDQSFNKPTLVRNNETTDSKNNSLGNISKITIILEPTDDNRATTKSYVDSVSRSNRIRRNSFMVMNDQGNDFNDNNLSNINSMSTDNIFISVMTLLMELMLILI